MSPASKNGGGRIGRVTDAQGLEIIETDTCLRLLGDQYLGRVAVVSRGRPTIRPVNYLLDGRNILIRTAPGTLLAAGRAGASAAFEVDGIDEIYHSGWSVVLQGELRAVVDADERRRLDQLPLWPWARAVPRTHWLRLRPTELSGRRIV